MAAKSNQKPDGDWTIAGTKVRLSRPPTPLSRNPRDQLAILMRSRTAVCASRRHLRTTLARRHNVSAWEAEAERARPHVADIASFEAELLSLLRPAYRLALGMTLDPALAEDVVQEAAFRAWERQAQRRPGTDLRPWLFAIVANHCRDLKRRPWARVVRLDASVEAPAAGTDVHRASCCTASPSRTSRQQTFSSGAALLPRAAVRRRGPDAWLFGQRRQVARREGSGGVAILVGR